MINPELRRKLEDMNKIDNTLLNTIVPKTSNFINYLYTYKIKTKLIPNSFQLTDVEARNMKFSNISLINNKDENKSSNSKDPKIKNPTNTIIFCLSNLKSGGSIISKDCHFKSYYNIIEFQNIYTSDFRFNCKLTTYEIPKNVSSEIQKKFNDESKYFYKISNIIKNNMNHNNDIIKQIKTLKEKIHKLYKTKDRKNTQLTKYDYELYDILAKYGPVDKYLFLHLHDISSPDLQFNFLNKDGIKQIIMFIENSNIKGKCIIKTNLNITIITKNCNIENLQILGNTSVYSQRPECPPFPKKIECPPCNPGCGLSPECPKCPKKKKCKKTIFYIIIGILALFLLVSIGIILIKK